MSITDKSSKRLPAAIGAGTDWVEEEELAPRLRDQTFISEVTLGNILKRRRRQEVRQLHCTRKTLSTTDCKTQPMSIVSEYVRSQQRKEHWSFPVDLHHVHPWSATFRPSKQDVPNFEKSNTSSSAILIPRSVRSRSSICIFNEFPRPLGARANESPQSRSECCGAGRQPHESRLCISLCGLRVVLEYPMESCASSSVKMVRSENVAGVQRSVTASCVCLTMVF